MNPYRKLQSVFSAWANKVQYPTTIQMWTYEDTKGPWDLELLKQKTETANKLGWDVVLSVTDRGLLVSYRKRPGNPPSGIYG